jgi:hypothetical protein
MEYNGIVKKQQYISTRVSAKKIILWWLEFVILRSAPRYNLIQGVIQENGWSPQGLDGKGPKPLQCRTRLCSPLVYSTIMLKCYKCLVLTRMVIICKVVCGVVVLEF